MKKFHQKKSKTDIHLTFENTKLHYFLKDESGKVDFSIPYHAFTHNSYERTDRNETLKNFAIYLLVVGIVTLVGGIGALMLIGSAIMYWLYKRSIIHFTVFLLPERQVFILHDEHHDAIIKEIFSHRDTYLKHTYARININNPPEHELKKFQWLLDEKVITEEEFHEFKFQLMKKESKILN